MDVNEPSVPTQAIHNARLSFTGQASQRADSTAPEGGYGWKVVFACCCVSFWAVGSLYSWGVMQAALFKQGLSSPSTLSWIGSLTFAWIALLALVNARVIRLLGARTTALLGIFTLSLGHILSGFGTHHVGVLFFTTGILSGIGTSLCYFVVNVTPTQYFYRRRGLANGLVCAGGGLGGTVISLVMDVMIQHIGPAWTFRTLGLMTLSTALPAAWLIRERTPIQSDTFIEWHLFHNYKFITIFLVGVIATFPLLVPFIFIPLYSSSLHLSSNAGAALVAAYNISSAIGRLTAGIAGDSLGPLNTLLIVLFFTTISIFVIWPVTHSLGPMILFVIMNGASNGGFFATIPTVVGSEFGSQRVSVAMGMIVTGWVGGYLLGAPIAAYILEAHTSGGNNSPKAYHPTMFYAGTLAAIAMFLVAAVRLCVDRRIKRRV